MFIHVEYSLQVTSKLQWSTRYTTLQIDTRSYLHLRGHSTNFSGERSTRKTIKWIPILGRQPLSPPRPRTQVVARKPLGGIPLAMITGARGRQPQTPPFWDRSVWEELYGGGTDNPGRFFLLGWSHASLHVAIPPMTSAPPSDPFDNSRNVLLQLATLGAKVLATVRHRTS